MYSTFLLSTSACPGYSSDKGSRPAMKVVNHKGTAEKEMVNY